jgi:uncharacterized protein
MGLMIPAGSVRLEAILREPEHGIVHGAAVLCHPHPVYGGTMNTRIIYRAGKAAMAAGYAALRFNFRGVGASTGSYDRGVGEQADVTAAIDWLEHRFPDLPLAMIGFSFGAWVGLQVGCVDPRIRAMAGLGIPLNLYSFDFLLANRKPTLLIVGTRDEFCATEKFHQLARRLPDSSSAHPINEANHFFTNQLNQVQDLIADFFRGLELD